MNSLVILFAFSVAATANLTLATDISGGWVLGNAGASSCSAVCQNAGKTCNAASMQALDTKWEFDYVNTRLGSVGSCSLYTSAGLKSTPSINPALGNCNFNGSQAICGSPSATMPSAVRRVCCCQASGCLLTNPVCLNLDCLLYSLPFIVNLRGLYLLIIYCRPSIVKSRSGLLWARARPLAAQVSPHALALS
jgi:hypothetical protein